MVVLLNSPARAAVGVAVKPPDESFRRLETARLNPVPVCTVRGPDLRRGVSDRHDRQADRPGYLSSHTDYTLPPFGG